MASFVKNVGTAAVTNSSTAVITVPAGGVAAGDMLFVRWGRATAGASVSSIVDTRSNAYTQLAAGPGINLASELWYARITTTLVSGDTITVTLNAAGTQTASVEQFTGEILPIVVDGTAGTSDSASTTTPTASVSNLTHAADIVLGELQTLATDTVTQPTDSNGGDTWHALTTVTSTQQNYAAYKVTTSVATQTYNPTLLVADGCEIVLGAVAALLPASPTPPLVPPGLQSPAAWRQPMTPVAVLPLVGVATQTATARIAPTPTPPLVSIPPGYVSPLSFQPFVDIPTDFKFTNTVVQTAAARIQQVGLTATQTATARVQTTGTTTQLSVANVAPVATPPLVSIPPGYVSPLAWQPFDVIPANFAFTGTATQPATARVQQVGLTSGRTAIARIQVVGTGTQPATGNIFQPPTGGAVAPSTPPGLQAPASFRLSFPPLQPFVGLIPLARQTAVARIAVHGSASQPATAAVAGFVPSFGLRPRCGASVQCCAIRVATLDTTGRPLPGVGNIYCTDALSQFTLTPVYAAEVDITMIDPTGSPVVLQAGRKVFKRLDCTLDLLFTDPELETIMTGGTVISQAGFSIGAGCPQVGLIGAFNGISVELWSKHIVNGDIDPVYPYIRWVLPRVYWQAGNTTLVNAPSVQSYTGITVENPNWGMGPYGDWTGDSTRAVDWQLTNMLPSPTCGAAALPQVAFSASQAAVGRVRKTRLSVQTAKMSVQGVRTSTQPAHAWLGVVANTIQTGKASVAAPPVAVLTVDIPPGLQSPAAWRQVTRPVLSGLTPSLATTQPAITRVQVVGTSTQTSAARLRSQVNAPQPATTRVQVIGVIAQTAVARLRSVIFQTAIARIVSPSDALIPFTTPRPPGLQSPTAWQQPFPPVAALPLVGVATQTATARIRSVNNQTARSRIVATGKNPQAATARIVRTVTAAQTTTARLSVIRSAGQTAAANMTSTGSTTQPAVARIGVASPLTAILTVPLPPGLQSPAAWHQPRFSVTVSPLTTKQTATCRIAAIAHATQSAKAKVGTGASWVLVQNLVAPNQTGGQSADFSIAATFGSNVTAGNRLFLFSDREIDTPGGNATVVDSQGNTWTNLVTLSGDIGGANLFISLWTAVASATGSLTITVTAPGDAVLVDDLAWSAQEYSGLDSSAGAGCLDVSAKGVLTSSSTANASTGTTAATHAANQLALAFVAGVSFQTWTLVTANGFTKVAGASDNNNSFGSFAVANKVSGLGATESAVWTNGGATDSDGALVVVIKHA